MKGKVLRRAGDKTVVVEATYVSRHPLYKKKVVRTRRFLVHDPDNSAKIGEEVTAEPTRPLSRHKRWVLTRPV